MDFSISSFVPSSHSSITDSTYLAGVDFDSLPDSLKLWNESYAVGSPIYQPSNTLTQRPTLLQYSKTNDHFYHPQLAVVSSPSASFNGSDNLATKMFYGAGDFQNKKRAESPVLSCESSITIEGMNKAACRYSPEEKKERIERYRNKRTQRNFNKKIKYECRKSLADSRPRIRGRFARYNEEVVKNHGVQWSHGRDEGGETNDGDNWIEYIIDTYSANLIP